MPSKKAATYHATQRPIPTVVDGYTVETSSSKSGYVGITRTMCNSRWKAMLGNVLVGTYVQKADAVTARTRAKIKQLTSKK